MEKHTNITRQLEKNTNVDRKCGEKHTNIDREGGKTQTLTEKLEKHTNINREGRKTHKH